MSVMNMPFFQDVEGIRVAGFYSADVFRDSLKYKARPGDLFVSGYPKSGTNWLQQIVALIQSEGKSPKTLAEYNSCTTTLDMFGTEGVHKLKGPGVIKTHMPFHRAANSPESKHLHVVRNPFDVAVSFYHHTCCDIYKYSNATFSDFFELFFNGQTEFGDYFDHVLGWYEHREDPNLLFLTYEQLKLETVDTIKLIADFMGEGYSKTLENEVVMNDVLKYSNLEYMKSFFNEALQSGAGFDEESDVLEGLKKFVQMSKEITNQDSKKFELIRQGEVGDWRNVFTEEQQSRLSKKTEEKLSGTKVFSYWKMIGCI